MSKVILLVEDEVVFQRVLETALSKTGFRTISCNNGQECLDELARGTRPDLLLLDLEMPVMSGLDVLKELGDTRRLDDLPTIVLSAHAERQLVVKAIELGAQDYILKPFQPRALKQSILDAFFDVDEETLRTQLSHLREQDGAVFTQAGMSRWAGGAWKAYPSMVDGSSLVFLVSAVTTPRLVATSSTREVLDQVRVFRQCKNVWRKIWPTASSLASPSAAPAAADGRRA